MGRIYKVLVITLALVILTVGVVQAQPVSINAGPSSIKPVCTTKTVHTTFTKSVSIGLRIAWRDYVEALYPGWKIAGEPFWLDNNRYVALKRTVTRVSRHCS